MAFGVKGDILEITLPATDAQGKALTPASVTGTSWLPFGVFTQVDAISQKESMEFGFISNKAKVRQELMERWSEQPEVSGRVRNRHGALVPMALDTVLHRDTSSDDLAYISLILGHHFYPQTFPYAPMTAEEVEAMEKESAEGNGEAAQEEAEAPTSEPPPEPENDEKPKKPSRNDSAST